MYHQYREGYIEVICGCMFAGKTEELIRKYEKAGVVGLLELMFYLMLNKKY